MATPKYYESAVNAAFSLYFGRSIAEAASDAAVSEETVKKWTQADWWPEIMAEIEPRAQARLEALARGALLKNLERGDATSARWLLERRDRHFAPPTKQVEVIGQVDHVHAQREQLAPIPTEILEAIADGDEDDAIDAYFEEANPRLLSDSDPTSTPEEALDELAQLTQEYGGYEELQRDGAAEAWRAHNP